MLVLKCEICKNIENKSYNNSEKYCLECQQLIFDIRQEEYEKLKQEYSNDVNNLISIKNLCKYLYEKKLDEFENHFGKSGVRLLLKCLNKQKENENES